MQKDVSNSYEDNKNSVLVFTVYKNTPKCIISVLYEIKQPISSKRLHPPHPLLIFGLYLKNLADLA